MKNSKYIIFDASGGIGKNIAATAVVSNIKIAYPDSKIIVVASWPRVFIGHPDVWRVFGNGELRYFYEDYVKDKDFLLLKTEPYHHTDYIKKEKHLIEVWTEQCNIPVVVKTPHLHLNKREIEFYNGKYAPVDKPLFVLQSSGGINMPFPYSWTRDMPLDFTKKIIDILRQKYQILHFHMQNQFQYEGVFNVTCEDVRELFGVVNLNCNRLLIDSFAQHASAALGKKSTVLWPINNIGILGYSININILSSAVPKDMQKPYAYIEDYRLEGPLHDYPFDDGELFNPREIAEQFL